uniref:SURF1 family protein n=1 Tax=Paracoccus sp. TRP TaxID=412597 RepID=UPI000225F6CB|nr:SURF1 family protein [Paracoccus sp. TRP]
MNFRRLLAAAGALAVFLALIALGVWQVQRLAWKTDLIARVEARLAADPVPAPGPADWAGLDPRDAEYRRVTVSGNYRADSDTLVKAVTARGPGFWVMTPMRTAEGWDLLINRGFVPETARNDRPLPRDQVTVSGLLRMSQNNGGFLRRNDPVGGRWYSRDTSAIAAAQGIGPVAPYFIDADDRGDEAQPIGGLTEVRFRNSHLGYALTWFSLAALWAGGLIWLRRRGRA